VIELAEEKKKKSKGNGEDKEMKEKMTGEEAISEEEAKKKQEEMLEQLQEQIDSMPTKDIISQMMMSLSSLAYKKMGIPLGVNDKYKDKLQAKMAVDSFAALLTVIKDELSGEESENLQSSLSNLQLNFVKVFP